ncbi:MAG: hypothetical protein ACI8TQ_001667 [Planctomycetota bacterium]|jgi:hypothetical protein
MTCSRPLAPLLVVLSLGFGSCQSHDPHLVPFSASDPERQGKLLEIGQELDLVEVELEQGSIEHALELVQDIRDSGIFDAEIRHRTELLLEVCATRRLDELIANKGSVHEFEDLFEDDVPKNVRVSAGIAGARRQLEENEPIEAYSLIRRIDGEFSSHHERAAAGDILAQAGFALSVSTRYRLWLFSYRARAPEVLEYLVLNYPSNFNGERAYMILAELYEEDDELEFALERYEDLLLYYRTSQFVPQAEAKVPALRLQLIKGPNYDRSEILSAKRELLDWLARHPGHQLESQVLDSLQECYALEIDSDLFVAKFYRRVDKMIGARMHADRALAVAVEVGDLARADHAREILENVAPVEASTEDTQGNS